MAGNVAALFALLFLLSLDSVVVRVCVREDKKLTSDRLTSDIIVSKFYQLAVTVSNILFTVLVPVWKTCLHCSQTVVSNGRHYISPLLLCIGKIEWVGVIYSTSAPLSRVLSIKRTKGLSLWREIAPFFYSLLLFILTRELDMQTGSRAHWAAFCIDTPSLRSVLLRTNMVNSVLIWSTQRSCQPTQIEEPAVCSVWPCSVSLSSCQSISILFHSIQCRAVLSASVVLREGQN